MGDRRNSLVNLLHGFLMNSVKFMHQFVRDSGKKAQSSMEYLFITTFMFLLLLGIMVVAYTQSSSFSNDVAAAQIQKVGNEIVDTANTVYYAGPPTKKTLTLYFPENIRAVVINNQSISFTMQGALGSYDYTVYAVTNMTGAIRTFTGLHVITVTAGNNNVNVSG